MEETQDQQEEDGDDLGNAPVGISKCGSVPIYPFIEYSQTCEETRPIRSDSICRCYQYDAHCNTQVKDSKIRHNGRNQIICKLYNFQNEIVFRAKSKRSWACNILFSTSEYPFHYSQPFNSHPIPYDSRQNISIPTTVDSQYQASSTRNVQYPTYSPFPISAESSRLQSPDFAISQFSTESLHSQDMKWSVFFSMRVPFTRFRL